MRVPLLVATSLPKLSFHSRVLPASLGFSLSGFWTMPRIYYWLCIYEITPGGPERPYGRLNPVGPHARQTYYILCFLSSFQTFTALVLNRTLSPKICSQLLSSLKLSSPITFQVFTPHTPPNHLQFYQIHLPISRAIANPTVLCSLIMVNF